jgi:hypothetical protein
MIAYEELDRALARWKARRAGTVDGTDVPSEGDAADPQEVADEAISYQAPDSTGELDLADVVDEA